MAGVLRLVVPAATKPDCPGFDVIAGGRFSVSLDLLRKRLVERRDRIAERRGTPPRHEWDARQRQRAESFFSAIEVALEQVDGCRRRGEDMERPLPLRAGYGRQATGPVFEWFGAALIMAGDFLGVECGGCGQSLSPAECRVSDWGEVAAPLMGFGGTCLTCPLAHTLFFRETWVS